MRHIQIGAVEDCCGCSACAQICPRQCISFASDSQGFRYPRVDTNHCVDCGKCLKVCPFVSSPVSKSEVAAAYAAINSDNAIRQASSSGGVFYKLAKQILSEGGVIFGAKFNSDWSVSHGLAASEPELLAMLGSKYVQSDIGDAFSLCKQYLKAGRKVLFTGTPCQIAGLNKYLNNKYDDLLLSVEVICHGVPSPLVWKDYLDYYHKKNSISAISFRYKRPSWEAFSMKICTPASTYVETATDDPYMFGFLHNIFLRPSCYNCKVKGGISGADISLGDFWGIDKVLSDVNDSKGVSLVICHNSKAASLIDELGLTYYLVSAEQALKHNSAYSHSVAKPYRSDIFWKRYRRKGISCLAGIINSYAPTLRNRIINKLYTSIIYRK